MNAHFVLRIATDRDWAADVRAQVPTEIYCFCIMVLYIPFICVIVLNFPPI